MNSIALINKLISRLIHLIIFLTPVFFWPFVFDFYESSKQALLFSLISAAWLLWLLKSIFWRKNLTFKKTPLDIFLLLFLASGFVSAIFAIDRLSSFWGYYGRFNGGFLFLFVLISFVYLIIGNPLKSFRPANLLKTFLWSGATVCFISWLALVGFWQKLSFLPTFMQQGFFTPVAGSFDGLAVFLVIFVVLLLSLFCLGLDKFQKEAPSLAYTKVFVLVSLIFSLALLFFIKFNLAWYILLISLFFPSFFVFIDWLVRIKKGDKASLGAPALLLAVFIFSVLSLWVSTGAGKKLLPSEVNLSLGNSAVIAIEHFKKDPLLGAGPGNYLYVFSQSRPAGFNQSDFWQVRFDRSGSYLLELFSTYGTLGWGAYILMVLALLFVYSKALPYFWQQDKKQYFTPLIVLLSLLLAQVFYPQNTALEFSFWFFVALSLLSIYQSPARTVFKKRSFSFKFKPEWGALLGGLFFILVLGWILTLAFGFRGLLADTYYAKVALKKEANINRQVKFLDRAVNLNSRLPNYWALRAKIYLLLAKDIMAGQNITPKEQSEKLTFLLDEAIKSGQRATALAPQNPIFWENLGNLYSEMGSLVEGSYRRSQESFKKSFSLDPQNPIPAVLAAKAYLAEITGNNFVENSNQAKQAENLLNRALKLKPDYNQALVYLAMVKEVQEKPNEAVSILLDITKKSPKFLAAHFQLGRMYFNQNKLDLAASQFQKVIALNPNHANAHYSLGIIYKIKNQKPLALKEFQKVLELNPGNKDVAGKIREIQGLN